MMHKKEDYENFISEATPYFVQLTRICRKHLLSGENSIVWLTKDGISVETDIEEKDIQGIETKYRLREDGHTKITETVTMKNIVEVDENGFYVGRN